ncbi:MAG: hypothetical protein IJJ29_02245 [Solobacterium sp.]|nr:hypothetical protein [Solobacterium sp.]
MKQRVNISVTEDTAERLKQYAWEHHTTVSQAITDWIWSAKVKNEQIRGQMMLEECRRPALRRQ